MGRLVLTGMLVSFVWFHDEEGVSQEDVGAEPPKQSGVEDFREIRNSLLKVPDKKAECLVDSAGLPRRLLVTTNDTALFDEPEYGAKRIQDLKLHERLYVFAFDSGTGYHKAGITPWEEDVVGWVPSVYCLPWDHNEVVFLSRRSVQDGVNGVAVWANKEDAESGDAGRAIYHLPIDPAADEPSQFYPIIEKNESGTVYRIGVVDGGDEKCRDAYGQRLPEESLKEVVRNLQVVNIVFLLDTNRRMKEYVDKFIEEAPRTLEDLETAPQKDKSIRETPPLTVNVGCMAYHDESSHSEIEEVARLTSDREQLVGGLSVLRKEHSAAGIPALVKCLDIQPFARAALNRIVWITGMSPTENREELFAQIGAKARGRFVQVDVLLCGGDAATEAVYSSIAKQSGGQVIRVAEANNLIPTVVERLKDRIGYVPMERLYTEAAMVVEEDGAASSRLREVLEMNVTSDLGKSVDNYRRAVRLRKYLFARGVDVRSWDSRAVWIRVRPDERVAIRPYIAVPRSQLAKAISGALGALAGLKTERDLAENADMFLRSILELEAGPHASIGIEKAGTSAVARGANLPVVTTALGRGKDGVVLLMGVYENKVRGLIDFWRDPANEERGNVFVPLELIP
jgi:hypothetical protein